MELNIFDLKITKFFPYESVQVIDRLLSIDDPITYNRIKKEFKSKLGIDTSYSNAISAKFVGFDDTPPKVVPHEFVGFTKGYCSLSWDNKITFECVLNNSILYIAFYDNVITIGFSIRPRNNSIDKYIKIL